MPMISPELWIRPLQARVSVRLGFFYPIYQRKVAISVLCLSLSLSLSRHQFPLSVILNLFVMALRHLCDLRRSAPWLLRLRFSKIQFSCAQGVKMIREPWELGSRSEIAKPTRSDVPFCFGCVGTNSLILLGSQVLVSDPIHRRTSSCGIRRVLVIYLLAIVRVWQDQWRC